MLIEKFKKWFRQIEIVDIKQTAFLDAAKLRANFPSLKTPDALHLATAIYHNCDEFWTNDNHLDKLAPNIVKNML